MQGPTEYQDRATVGGGVAQLDRRIDFGHHREEYEVSHTYSPVGSRARRSDGMTTVALVRTVWTTGIGVGLTLAIASTAVEPALGDTSVDDATLAVVAAATPSTVAAAARVATSADGENAIDTTLADVDVTIPADPAEGIRLGSGADAVSIALPFAERAEDAMVEQPGIVSYDNNNGSTTVPIVQTDGSVQINTVIDDAKAPTEFAYPVSVPDGGKLQLEQGGVSILDSAGGWVAGFLPAWAKDADGNGVPTHYEVRGSTLVQVVEHDRAGTRYPVVADPWLGVNLISNWWWTGSGNSRAVHIAVTPMMGVVNEAIAMQFGWEEASSRIGPEIRKATYEQQFKCHALGKVAIFFDPGNWDLEVRRGTTNDFARLVSSHCNW